MENGSKEERGPHGGVESPTVLIVEDDADLAALYAEWIDGTYTVLVAHDGEQALEMLDEETDIVLLDRRMPRLSGKEALAEIRERNNDCFVAMVTAVAPDFDVLEMGFDHYLSKPVTKDDLSETVDVLLKRANYHGLVQRYYSLAARCAVLESEKSVSELDASDKYAALQAELDDLRDRVNEEITDMSTHQDFEGLFRTVGEAANTARSEGS